MAHCGNIGDIPRANAFVKCIFISKENFTKYGIYDENMKLGYEDWDLNIRLGTNKIIAGSKLVIFKKSKKRSYRRKYKYHIVNYRSKLLEIPLVNHNLLHL